MARKSVIKTKSDDVRPLVGFVTPHVHWDRAWYLPFQQYRYRLIEFVDDLLDLLEDPDSNYPNFEFDGQISTAATDSEAQWTTGPIDCSGVYSE